MSVLRPYQVDFNGSVYAAFESGHRRILATMAPGLGKTVCLAHLPIQFASWLAQFPAGHRKMLVIADRDELLRQAAKKIHAANPHMNVSIEKGSDWANLRADAIVASIQTLRASGFRRLQRILDYTQPRIVVVDEADLAIADSYQEAFVRLGFLPAEKGGVVPTDRVLIGVTATTKRTDGIPLGDVFQTMSFSYPTLKAIDDGWLTPVIAWSIDTSTSIEGVGRTRGDFKLGELSRAVNTPRRNAVALAAWKEHAEGRPTIGFAVDVAHAHELTRVFEVGGVRSVAVSGETPKDDRRLAIRQYAKGQIDVLFNCLVFGRGTDLPLTSCVLMARPTESEAIYIQATGRGLRPLEGDPVGPERLAFTGTLMKPNAVLIDLVDVTGKHSLQSAPSLYGLPPNLKLEGKELGHVARELEALMLRVPGFNVQDALAEQHLTLEQLGVMARKVEFMRPVNIGSFSDGRSLSSWVRVAEDYFRISYPHSDGYEVVEVVLGLLDKWEMNVSFRPKDPDSTKLKTTRTLGLNFSTREAAADAAERYVKSERPAVARLKDKGARWMSNRVSDGQLHALMQLGVSGKAIPHDLNAGDASQWIDELKARRA